MNHDSLLLWINNPDRPRTILKIERRLLRHQPFSIRRRKSFHHQLGRAVQILVVFQIIPALVTNGGQIGARQRVFSKNAAEIGGQLVTTHFEWLKYFYQTSNDLRMKWL